jgi:dTMP kinase
LDGVPIPFIAALNSAADRPHLAVILAGDPDVLAERVHSRGSNHRYETGADSAEREAILYREAAVLLASDGWTLTGIDTTRRHPDQVAASIAEHIERLP